MEFAGSTLDVVGELMSWLGSLLGVRMPGDLPVRSVSGVGGHILGNSHGRPDTVLVLCDGRVEVWPIRDLVVTCPRSIAWLTGYVDGFMVETEDLWPDDLPLGMEGSLAALERSWEGMRRGLEWVDPPEAHVRLVDRVSPFLGMSGAEYSDASLIGRFLLASTPEWWMHFQWLSMEDLMARVAMPGDDPDGDRADAYASLGGAVLGSAQHLAMMLAAVRDMPAARLVLTALGDRLGWDGQDYECSEPTAYPTGMAVIGDDEFVLEGDLVHVGVLRRSPDRSRIVLDGVGSIRSHVVQPDGALSAWWLRGYVAGREPTQVLVHDWSEGRGSDYVVWRMVVFLHHLRRDVAFAASLDDIDRLIDLCSNGGASTLGASPSHADDH